MRSWLLAGLVLLLASAAHARGGGRGVMGGRGGARGGGGRGFVAGRGAVRAAPSGGRSTGSSGWTAPSASRGGSVTRGSAVMGRRSSSGGRASFAGGVARSGGTFRAFGRRVDSTPSGGSTGGSGSQDAPPPYFYTPGALIRTAGQLPVYSDPGNAGTHSVEGGGFVAMDAAQARSLGGTGVGFGRPDARPSSGGGAGGNAVTANGPAFDPSF